MYIVFTSATAARSYCTSRVIAKRPHREGRQHRRAARCRALRPAPGPGRYSSIVIIVYYTILYYTILHYTILYHTIARRKPQKVGDLAQHGPCRLGCPGPSAPRPGPLGLRREQGGGRFRRRPLEPRPRNPYGQFS